jgi:hypothetical protein
MKLIELIEGLKESTEISKLIKDKKYKLTKQDVIDLAGNAYAPSPALCKMILEHGDAKQQENIILFLVGQMVEQKSLNMYAEVNVMAETLLEHFARLDEKALEAALAATGAGK